jgi:hypothetical protein
MQVLRHEDPKKKSGWIKALKKEFKTIIGSSALKNKERSKPDDVVASTPEANNIKLDQDGNVDKLKMRFFVREELQKKKGSHHGRSTLTSCINENVQATDGRCFQTHIQYISA